MIPERLRSIFWKEFIQMRRDRATFGMMLAVPAFQLLLFGFAVNMDVRNLPATVLDLSRTQQSRDLVQRFAATGNFRLTGESASYEDALRRVDRGWVRAAIVIPEDYARQLKRGASAQVQVLVDASDPSVSQNAIGAAQLLGLRRNLEIVASGTGARAAPPIDVRVRPLYNPALRTAIFIVPGIIGVLLSNILILITALAVVREREAGTLEQLIVTPLTRTEIMLGKIAPYVIVGYVQMTAVLIMGALLFHVPIRGSLLTIYLVAFVFIVASLGLGLFVSTLARTGAQAIQASFFFILPNIMLSGFMFPREGMPPFAQALGWGIPLTYFLQILRGVILKGVGFEALWPQALALVGFAILFFAFSVQRFQKTLD